MKEGFFSYSATASTYIYCNCPGLRPGLSSLFRCSTFLIIIAVSKIGTPTRGQSQARQCFSPASGHAKGYCVVILSYVVDCVVKLHIRQTKALDALQGPVKIVYCITSVATGPFP